MDLQAVRMFVDVMRLGSFAAAARQIDADPSSVSRTIAHLEEKLGFRLFQRTTRRLVATEAGALYFERIQPLIEDVEHAASAARDVVAEPSGRLRVTASVAFGTRVLVPLLPRFRLACPAVELELILSDSVIDLIAERVDVAVRLGARLDTGFIGTQLMRTRYHVCASPAYCDANGKPRRPKDLEARDCLLFPYQGFRSKWRFRSKGGATMEVPIKGSLVISNALALHRAACDGLGPVLLADWLVSDDIRRGTLIDLFPHHEVTATDFSTAAWILYPSRAYVPRKVRAFIDFIKREAGKRVDGKSDG
jgi:DNA-binding transcriptional LysR family regulator